MAKFNTSEAYTTKSEPAEVTQQLSHATHDVCKAVPPRDAAGATRHTHPLNG